MSNQPDSETSTEKTQHSQDTHPLPGWDSNL
jgi:hypothetical protein